MENPPFLKMICILVYSNYIDIYIIDDSVMLFLAQMEMTTSWTYCIHMFIFYIYIYTYTHVLQEDRT
jgi:hypothetical protein